MWSTACPDWEQRLLDGRTLVPDLPLFADEAAKALRIFKRLRIPDIRGRPTMGEVAGPWLFPIVEAIFGSYDEVTNRRMIQEFFWLIPKKNTKSSSAAAIMVEALILNRRPEGEFVLIAPTKEIADISFRQASGTIRADPELEKLFQAQTHIRKITHRRTGATLQVKAADTDVITGGKQVGTLVDELHVLADKSNAADILLEVRGALTARPDGFLIFVTTQSKKPPHGVFKSELRKARDVRDGRISLPLLPILYELPPSSSKDGGWKDQRLWGAVNPNLGRSVDGQYLVRELAAAENEGPAQLALFASQHLNVEIGLGLRTDRWAGADHWERQAQPGLDLEQILVECDVVTVGVDGGGLDDLLGMAVLGRQKVTRKWLLWSRAWAHESVLERRKGEASKLLDFQRDGDLVVVSDMAAAFVEVADIVEQVNDAGVLASVGFDPVGVGLIVDELSRRGITQEAGQVQGVSQGFKLTGTIKTAEVQLSDGKMVHAGQALMAWCVGNAKVEPKGNAIVITKQVSGSAKIDPLMAALNAVAIMSGNPKVNSAPSIDAFLAAPVMVI